LPQGQTLREQRLDETVAGNATTITLIDAKRTSDWIQHEGADGVARSLGLDPAATALAGWDVFDAVLTPGDVILLISWRDKGAAENICARCGPAVGRAAAPGPHRQGLRHVRPARGSAILPGRRGRRDGPRLIVSAQVRPASFKPSRTRSILALNAAVPTVGPKFVNDVFGLSFM